MAQPSAGFFAAFLAALALLASSVPALEVGDVLYDRAFSPNADGIQDTTAIRFTVGWGETWAAALGRRVRAGIYAAADEPWLHSPLVALVDSSATGPAASESMGYATAWDGRDGGSQLLPDGFYYLQLFVEAISDSSTWVESLWLDPPIQLELNTAPPSFHSVAVEPGEFTPLASGADSVIQIFFNSMDFNPATDHARARVLYGDPEFGELELLQLERDPDYAVVVGAGLTRYRLLWNGKDGEGLFNDGAYRAEIALNDDAGNPPPPPASLAFDLDALAPELEVHHFGAGGRGATSFYFPPELLPDSLFIFARDRNGLDSCLAAWGEDAPFATPGTPVVLEADSAIFAFDVPDGWSADSTYRIRLDATDGAGNHSMDLDATLSLSVRLDGQAPPAPVWTVEAAELIQGTFELRGRCEESGAQVTLYEDGDSVRAVNVDANLDFMTPVLLHAGRHLWTAVGVDRAGNRSPLSASLALTYSPGPAVVMPGRFHGREGEEILVNTREAADAVVLRVYDLDGTLRRRLDAVQQAGIATEYAVSWDLRDEHGDPLMDGLYVIAIQAQLSSGSSSVERKVVAIARD